MRETTGWFVALVLTLQAERTVSALDLRSIQQVWPPSGSAWNSGRSRPRKVVMGSALVVCCGTVIKKCIYTYCKYAFYRLSQHSSAML